MDLFPERRLVCFKMSGTEEMASSPLSNLPTSHLFGLAQDVRSGRLSFIAPGRALSLTVFLLSCHCSFTVRSPSFHRPFTALSPSPADLDFRGGSSASSTVYAAIIDYHQR